MGARAEQPTSFPPHEADSFSKTGDGDTDGQAQLHGPGTLQQGFLPLVRGQVPPAPRARSSGPFGPEP